MSSGEGEAYWEERGRAAAASELDAVCYAGAPPFLNRYAAWAQRRAVERLLAAAGGVAGLRVLDLGCGTGRWSRLLAARGARVVGTDRSESMLAAARERSPGVEFRRMDATALSFADDEFDLAVAVTVLQHLPHADQERAMAELLRVVRGGGHVATVDRSGTADEFAAAHGTFPRPRAEWVALWRRLGAEPVRLRGQEFSYPLRLAALGRRSGVAAAPAAGVPARRGAHGWRREALRALTLACYPLEVAGGALGARLPAEHLAGLYVVRR